MKNDIDQLEAATDTCRAAIETVRVEILVGGEATVEHLDRVFAAFGSLAQAVGENQAQVAEDIREMYEAVFPHS